MARRYPRNTSTYSRKVGRQHSRRKTTSKSSPWLWLVCGVLIGLLIPGMIYLKHAATAPSMQEETEIKRASITRHSNAMSSKVPKLPCPQKKIAHSTTPKAHYDFYDLLASQECAEKAETNDVPKPAPHKTFQLDIAIFENYSDADELKAELALGGFDNVNIKKSIQDDQAVYRVIAGPFDTKGSAEKAQKQLKEVHNVAATVTSSSEE